MKAAFVTSQSVRRCLKIVLITAPAALFAVHISSCSLIGLGAGAVVDGVRKDRTPRALVKIQKGSSLKLRLRDGRWLQGHFDGRRDADGVSYAREWAAWRDTSSAFATLPSPGDSVILARKDGSTCSGRLVAYQIDAIRLTAGDEPCVATIESVAYLADHGGQRIDQGLLRDVTTGGKIPLSTLIRLKMAHETIDVPVHEVELVLGPAPRGGKIVGFVIGLSIDTIAVAGAVASLGSSGCSSSGFSLSY